MKRAYGYVRVSTDDQKESILMQPQMIRDYSTYHKIELVDIVTDEDISGGMPIAKRPAGSKVVQAIKSREINCVVSIRLERIFRNTIDALSTVEEWSEIGASLHIIDMGGLAVDTTTATGKFVFTFLAASCQFERDKTAERTKMILNNRKKRGAVYSREVYGFSNVNGIMVENPDEQKVIREIMDLHFSGESFNKIARTLNEKGVRTKDNKKWYASTISNIVENNKKLRAA